MLAGGVDPLGVFQHPFGIVRLFPQQHHQTHDGVHRCPDIVADAAKEGTFGLVGHLGHLQGLGQGVLHLAFLGPVGDIDDDFLLVLHGNAIDAFPEPLPLLGLEIDPLRQHGTHGVAGLHAFDGFQFYCVVIQVYCPADHPDVLCHGILGDAQDPLNIGADVLRPLC